MFARKAHPADRPGQDFIRHIVELSRSPELRGHIYIMENYDHRVARFLVQGVDVWVNNPRPPEEASGTSGMKAAINGAINASVLDGWWAEATRATTAGRSDRAPRTTTTGPRTTPTPSPSTGCSRTRSSRSSTNGTNRGPQEWVELMKRSMKSTLAAFSSQRMVKEYAEFGVSETWGNGWGGSCVSVLVLTAHCRRDQEYLAGRLAAL